MFDCDNIRKTAIKFACKRGWQRKIAKKSGFEQTLFNHSMTSLDTLLSLLKIISLPNHFGLNYEEQKALIVATLAHDVGKDDLQATSFRVAYYLTYIAA